MGAALAIENVSGSTVKELMIGMPGQDVAVGDVVVDGAGAMLRVVGGDDAPGSFVVRITQSNDDIVEVRTRVTGSGRPSSPAGSATGTASRSGPRARRSVAK